MGVGRQKGERINIINYCVVGSWDPHLCSRSDSYRRNSPICVLMKFLTMDDRMDPQEASLECSLGEWVLCVCYRDISISTVRSLELQQNNQIGGHCCKVLQEQREWMESSVECVLDNKPRASYRCQNVAIDFAHSTCVEIGPLNQKLAPEHLQLQEGELQFRTNSTDYR